MKFFNRYGSPVTYLKDNEVFYSFSGRPLAYLKDEVIYSYQGKCLGWLIDGWVRDRTGNAVFFGDNPVGGPLCPLTKLAPIPSLPKIPPIPSIPEIPPIRPLLSLNWAVNTGEDFFS